MVSSAQSAKASHGLAHWQALDGMRAVAVLLVMCFHLFIRHFFPGGLIGVDIFFVLSGFLITTLLIGEWEKRTRIKFSAFYIRRALRLLPADFAKGRFRQAPPD